MEKTKTKSSHKLFESIVDYQRKNKSKSIAIEVDPELSERVQSLLDIGFRTTLVPKGKSEAICFIRDNVLISTHTLDKYNHKQWNKLLKKIL